MRVQCMASVLSRITPVALSAINSSYTVERFGRGGRCTKSLGVVGLFHYEADEFVFPPFLVKLDGIEELRQLLYDAMQVGICWLSVNNFEYITPRFEQRVEVIGNIHGPLCPSGRLREPLLSVPADGGRNRYCGKRCLVVPDL